MASPSKIETKISSELGIFFLFSLECHNPGPFSPSKRGLRGSALPLSRSSSKPSRSRQVQLRPRPKRQYHSHSSFVYRIALKYDASFLLENIKILIPLVFFPSKFVIKMGSPPIFFMNSIQKAYFSFKKFLREKTSKKKLLWIYLFAIIYFFFLFHLHCVIDL